jgi:hypothetical protein
MAHSTSKANQYLVHHQGEIQGPFEVDFIEAMIMSGVYPSSVIVENAVTSQKSHFSSILEAQQRTLPPAAHARPTPQRESSQRPRGKARAKNGSEAMTAFYVIAAIVGCVVICWIVTIVSPTSSKKTTTAKASTSSSSNRTYTPNQPTAPSKPTPKPRKRTTYKTPRATLPPVDTRVYRDAHGNTYRVSNSDYLRLSSMKTALTMKGNRVESAKIRLSSLASEVDRDRRTLDRTSQYQVDAFNRKVGRVNAMNDSVQSLVNDYNRDVNSFNRELERVGTLIR